MTNSASLSLLNACNITPLIIDIPHCKPRHFLMGEKSPSAACRTEWAEAEPHSLSQSVSWHRRRLRRLPRYFSQVSHSVRRQNNPSGLNNNKRKKKREKKFVFDVHSTRCEKERETKQAKWERSGCCWGVYITWDSTCNLVSPRGKLDTAR